MVGLPKRRGSRPKKWEVGENHASEVHLLIIFRREKKKKKGGNFRFRKEERGGNRS